MVSEADLKWRLTARFFSRIREMKSSSHAIRCTPLPMRRTDERLGFSVTTDTATLYTLIVFDPDANNAFKYRN